MYFIKLFLLMLLRLHDLVSVISFFKINFKIYNLPFFSSLKIFSFFRILLVYMHGIGRLTYEESLTKCISKDYKDGC